jgi:hypothetical protein
VLVLLVCPCATADAASAQQCFSTGGELEICSSFALLTEADQQWHPTSGQRNPGDQAFGPIAVAPAYFVRGSLTVDSFRILMRYRIARLSWPFT